MNVDNETPPLIIGGGLAGLTAAIRLAQRGRRPILLEAHSEIGGRLRNETAVTIRHNGRDWTFNQEHGVHGLWRPYVNLKTFLAEHDLAPAFRPAQDETWILGEYGRVRHIKIGRAIRRSLIPAPFHYLQLFFKPSFLACLNLYDWLSLWRVAGALFAAMSIDPLAERQPLHGLSLADLTQGWTPHWRALFAGLARNALAAEPEQIPAAGFIAFLRFYTLLRRDAWEFDFLTAGSGEAICQPLANKLVALGGQIMTNCAAQRIEQTENGAWRVTAQTSEVSETSEVSLTTTDLILALDAPAARRLLQNSPDTAALAADAYFPPGVATAVVRLWYDRPPHRRVSESGMFSGDFIVHNFFWLHELQTAYQEWAAATGGSAVEMHIYGPPDLLAQPDALLLARAVADANRAFPELRDGRLHSHLQRNPPTHTLFGLGTAGQNIPVKTALPGLYCCGDWVYDPIPPLYMERAAATGLLAANEILTRHGRAPFPLQPYPAPEPFAGWLARLWRGFRKMRRKA
jgi:carotenoid phi-ring synthase / carotenoid chi-ring synthase